MYAVIKTGGKQYRVTAGQILEVEKLEGGIGDSVTLDEVLLVTDGDDVTIGQPVVDGASILAKITGQYRGKKILSFRYRAKKRIRVRRGHRQYLTRLEIESVSFGGKTHGVAAKAQSTTSSASQPSMPAAVAEAAFDPADEVEAASENIGDMAESAVENAVDLGASAVESVSDATETVMETVVETVAETTSDAVEAVADSAEAAGEAIADAAESVSDAAESAVDAVVDAATNAVDGKENA